MRILFLTDNFPPETNAPAVRTFEHARVWAEAGHAVTVVTGVPNFPVGRIYEGYRNRPRSVEYVDGIRVVRVWTYVAPNKGLVRRTLDYLSFLFTAVPAACAEERPDVVVGTSPQFFTAVAACIVARLRRAPFVFELRDLWPESITAVGAVGEGPVVGMLGRLAHHLYRRADCIVSVTESFRSILAGRGIDPGKIAVVRNGVDLGGFRPDRRDNGVRHRLGIPSDRFVATYVGTIGMAHGLEHVLEAAEMLSGDGVHLLIVGEGARREELVDRAADMRLDNVSFLEAQPREDVPAILAASDAVLVHLKDDPLFRHVIPSKIFEAMAVGRPIVHAVMGESASIVNEARCGITVKPEYPLEMAAAIRRLKSDPDLAAIMGANGRNAAEGEFCRNAAAFRMLDVLRRVAGDGDDEVSRPSRPPSPDSPEAVPQERPAGVSRGTPSRSSAAARRS
ncbi:MAG: glycosyltransferase [Candidatus Eisenbacteria bacterium]|nr:glycosyltransferase [Candidatus Eisenbacteria bacterium]